MVEVSIHPPTEWQLDGELRIRGMVCLVVLEVFIEDPLSEMSSYS